MQLIIQLYFISVCYQCLQIGLDNPVIDLDVIEMLLRCSLN